MGQSNSICIQSAIWDLHIHSNQCTKPDKDLAKMTVSDYVDGLLEVLKSSKRLEMISFTDHNRISLDVYREFERRKSGISLVPGIEVDVKLEEEGCSKHLVVYFDCVGDMDKLVEVAGKVNDIMVGHSVSNSHPILIATLLNELLGIGVRFAVSPHAFKQGKRGIDYDWHCLDPGDRPVDKYIDQLFCFWEASGASHVAYAIQFLKEMDRGDRESVVSFSDSKDFEKLKHYLDDPPQYFNALPTFDGMQMVGTELTRIVPEPTDVPEAEMGKYIGEVDLGGQRIAFSPRLNAVIGGRGSGKSVLIDRIAMSIQKGKASELEEERREFLAQEVLGIASMSGSDIVSSSFKFEFFNQSYITSLFAKTGAAFNDALETYFESAFSQINDINAASIKAENDKSFNELLSERDSQPQENLVGFASKYLLDRDEKLLLDIKETDKAKADSSLESFSYEGVLRKLERVILKALSDFLKGDTEIVAAIDAFKAAVAGAAYKKRVEYLDGSYAANSFIDRYAAKKNSLSEASKAKSDAGSLFKETFKAETDAIVNRARLVKAYLEMQDGFESHYENPIVLRGEREGAFRFKKTLDVQQPINYMIKCFDDAIKNPGQGQACSRLNLMSYIKLFCFDEGCYKAGNSADQLEESLKSFNLKYVESYSIEYLGESGQYEDITKKSPGTRTNILLEYIVHRETSVPLLIDQPEDNVDNKTIYRDIKRWFMELKQKRQVIVVTHDANIVINADAENVIIAEQNANGGFNYHHGALEAPGILMQASEILDGGADAVRRRLMKYGG